MKCNKCGAQLVENAQFCPVCGAVVENQVQPAQDFNQSVSMETQNTNKNIDSQQLVNNLFDSALADQAIDSNFSQATPEVTPVINEPMQDFSQNLNQNQQVFSQPENLNIQPTELSQDINPTVATTQDFAQDMNTNVQPTQDMNSNIQPMQNFSQDISQQPVQDFSQNLNQEQALNLNQQPYQEAPSQNYNQPIQSQFSSNIEKQNEESTYYNSGKNSNNVKFIIFGILIVVLVAVIVVLAIQLMNKSDDNTTTNNNGSDVTQTTTQATTKVSFDGYTVNVPTNLIYEISNNYLLIYNEEKTKVATISMVDMSLANIKLYLNSFITTWEDGGMTLTDFVTNTYNNVEYMSSEVYYSYAYGIVAFTKATDTATFLISIESTDTNYDYSMLETIAPIISSVLYTGETSSMKVSSYQISDYINAAIEAE